MRRFGCTHSTTAPEISASEWSCECGAGTRVMQQRGPDVTVLRARARRAPFEPQYLLPTYSARSGQGHAPADASSRTSAGAVDQMVLQSGVVIRYVKFLPFLADTGRLRDAMFQRR